MHLRLEGWDRVTGHERDLLPIDLDDAHVGQPGTYPPQGANIEASPKGITIRYRLAIGEATMGGNYKAELYLTAHDVARLFVAIFKHHTFDRVLHFLNGGTNQGLSIRSMWRGPDRGPTES